MFISAIILAAGRSERMGFDKLLAKINGTPAFLYSIHTFERSGVNEIILAVPAEKISEYEKEISCRRFSIPVKIISGADIRHRSALLGINATDSRCELLLIHDAARPFVTESMIQSVIASAKENAAAIPVVKLSDTVKFCENGYVSGTPDRDSLRAVQTPQGFLKKDYLDALEKVGERAEKFTDDASLFEAAGKKVAMTDGDPRCFKLTSPQDMLLARMIAPDMGVDNMPRIGHGYDVHRFAEGRKLILCGKEIEYSEGLLGHSDADVAVHALMDAMLGAAALGDIGRHFPDNDPQYKGISSITLLKKVNALLKEKSLALSNADITIIAERPKLKAHIEDMRGIIADAVEIDISRVSVKATTEEGLGIAGKGIAAHAVVLLESV